MPHISPANQPSSPPTSSLRVGILDCRGRSSQGFRSDTARVIVPSCPSGSAALKSLMAKEPVGGTSERDDRIGYRPLIQPFASSKHSQLSSGLALVKDIEIVEC
ncbi:hypothetical protein M3I53_37470 [Paraburkholderia sp. CNPSo 3272]|uniref:hypothetical protein n=1 Tax=Paraburkholderia sp. CNPSo 3272 TaxID=2940931 RepID=UPI0020B82D7B|nr:hypothetical protein [Paraburkholderia sp. CNPSo 3272]MCP3728710.1 hypothetical protein [Paraburkholderia sp. CNPSo 3272]